MKNSTSAGYADEKLYKLHSESDEAPVTIRESTIPKVQLNSIPISQQNFSYCAVSIRHSH